MLNFLNQYQLIKGKAAFGVELLFSSKDNFTLVAVELTVNKDALEITRRFVDITLEDLAKANEKKHPVYCSIGGKGVIHKKVKIDDYTKDQELLNQVLPNASLKDFYIQKSILSANECWVSAVRKDVLDNLLEQMGSFKLFTVQVYLGPFILENVIPLISQPSIITTSHELLIEDEGIIELNSMGSVSSGEEYTIEEELVNSHEIIAFGSALNHYVPTSKITSIVASKIDSIRAEYFNKNKFVAVGFSLLVLFFVLTVVNMLIGNSYQQTNNELQLQVNSKREYVVELETLQEEVKTKEQFIQNSGVAQAAKISYYADQLALSVPESIQLNRLFINPLQKRINKAEDILFKYNKIQVTGTVAKSIDLNNWVKTLKQQPWIKHIMIISFIQENVAIAGEFELEIEVKGNR